jgi:hypothetical protein
VCDNDTADRCAGTSNTCNDAFRPSTVTCRADAGQCDVAEMCTGTSGACPADAFEPATTSCTGDSQGGVCDNDAGDRCSGVSNTCMDAFRPATFTCREQTGQCDVAEQCTGGSGECPADAVAPEGMVCGASLDQCDAVDLCNGTDKTCPDLKAAEGTPCSDDDICTVGDTCDGSGTCEAGPGDACSVAKITGGGQVVPNSSGKANFGFVAQRKTEEGLASGHFNYVNHTTGLHVNGAVTALVAHPDGSITFSGTGFCGALPCTFTVTVRDVAEPGKDKDTIRVIVSVSPAEVSDERKIIHGNIQVHKSP